MAFEPAARRFLQAALLLDLGAQHAGRARRGRSRSGLARSGFSRLLHGRAPCRPPPRQTPDSAISSLRMPSRRPRSATRRRSDGHTARIASRMAQPASTRSARSAPMQGLATRSAKLQPKQLFHHAVDAAAIHPQAIDPAAVVAVEAEMHAGERRHRSGRTEQVETAAGANALQLVAPLEGLQQSLHLVDHRREDLAGNLAAAEAFRQRHHADRQRRPRHDVVGEPGAAMGRDVDERDLRGAAADIEQHDAVGVTLDQRTAAGDGEPRLGLPVDDLQRQARLRLDTVEKGRAVVGRAAGFRGDQPDPPQGADRQLVGAYPQRLDGAIHRRLSKPAIGRQPFAQPHDARECVDDAELARASGNGDEQPAVVGAEVERGEHRQIVGDRPARLRRPLRKRSGGLGHLDCWSGNRIRNRFGDTHVAGENLAVAPALAPFLGFRGLGMAVRGPSKPALWQARFAGRRQRFPRRAPTLRRGAGIGVFHVRSFCAARTSRTPLALEFSKLAQE